jgi:hypothetical protein
MKNKCGSPCTNQFPDLTVKYIEDLPQKCFAMILEFKSIAGHPFLAETITKGSII